MLFLILLIYFSNIGLALPSGSSGNSPSTQHQLDEKYFDDRTLWSIVWSCFVTLFTCSWVAVHPNVPSVKDSGARILGRRLATMGYMLLAPELVIAWAANQYFSAKEIATKYRGREWTMIHGFFIIMGGFALHDADKSFLRVLDERTFEELDIAKEIEWPTITENEIQDRSKADIFSKGIVLLQTTWFIIQCVSRFTAKLAVTELEVVTLAFALLNAITYWLWWDKPSDVRRSVPVYLKTLGLSSNSKVSKARQQRDAGRSSPSSVVTSHKDSFSHRRDKHGHILAILYTILWVPIKLIFGPLYIMIDQEEIPDDDLTRVPTFYSPIEKKQLPVFIPSTWTMICVIALFGAIHFIPWPSPFPTAAEKWLWRVSTILIAGGPLFLLLLIAMADWFSNPFLAVIFQNPVISIIFILLLIATYIFSRIILLVLPVILLRSLPPSAFLKLKWSEFFPHL